jgi:hypothetical protein
MALVLCASVLIQPYDQTPGLEKCVQFLYIIQLIFLFGVVMGMEKRNNLKKAQCYI